MGRKIRIDKYYIADKFDDLGRLIEATNKRLMRLECSHKKVKYERGLYSSEFIVVCKSCSKVIKEISNLEYYNIKLKKALEEVSDLERKIAVESAT